MPTGPIETLDYPEPHAPSAPQSGDVEPSPMSLANEDVEKAGEWPWPQYPLKAPRNYAPLVNYAARAAGQRYTGWEGDFLDALRNSGLLRLACEVAGVSFRLIKKRRNDTPDFDEAYREAQIMASERLEQEARRRAVVGVKRTKYATIKGRREVVEEVTEYSDRLLIILMQANNPQKFRPDAQEHSSLIALEERARSVARQLGMPPDKEESMVAEARRLWSKTQ